MPDDEHRNDILCCSHCALRSELTPGHCFGPGQTLFGCLFEGQKDLITESDLACLCCVTSAMGPADIRAPLTKIGVGALTVSYAE